MDRFIVIDADEARDKGYPEAEDYYHGHLCYLLYETDGKMPIRLVGSDAMEPEDALLTRDLRWVVEELNRLAFEAEQYRQLYYDEMGRSLGILAE